MAPHFLAGNGNWLGREHGCNEINNLHNINKMKVDVEYRMIYANHTSDIQFNIIFKPKILQIGLCFPKSCKTGEVKEMSEKIFQSGFWNSSRMLGSVSFISTKTLNLRKDFYTDPLNVALM